MPTDTTLFAQLEAHAAELARLRHQVETLAGRADVQEAETAATRRTLDAPVQRVIDREGDHK